LFEGNDDMLVRLDALLGSGSELEIRVNETALTATGLDSSCGAQPIVTALRPLDGLSVNVRSLCQAELRSFPSSWSKRLGFGRVSNAFLIEGVRRLR
jgi:hypothetical protein